MPLTASEILAQFNAVVFSSFSTTADVEGRTVIGGTMTGGATFNLAPDNSAASAFSALTVYGSQTGSGSYNINNGGGVFVAGANAGGFTLNNGGDISIGGSNSGRLSVSGGPGSVAIGGSNSAQVNLSKGGGIFIGGNSSGQLSVNGGSGSVSVLGAASAPIGLNKGGSIYVGANTGGGALTVNGGNGTVSVNSSNAAQVTLNSGGTVRINGNTGNVTLNGGSLIHTRNATGNLNLNGEATATRVANASITPPGAPAITQPDFTTNFLNPMLALSTQLAALSTNSVARKTGNAVTLAASPDETGRAVFNLASSFFTPNSTIAMQLNGATTVIVNVTVDTCSGGVCAMAFGSGINFVNPDAYAQKVLWNFPNATSVAFGSEFGGTVLAPLAMVTNQSPIDGTLIAHGYSGHGELHSRPFTGSLELATLVSAVASPAPEPSGLLVLSAGLAGLVWVRTRAVCRNGHRDRANGSVD